MLPLKEFVSTAVTTEGIGGGGASTNEKESVMTQQVRQTETQKLRMSLSGHHPSWWRPGNRN